jgi:peptide/nickel transport system substrate-binding protein
MKKGLVLALLVLALGLGLAFDASAQNQPERGGTLKIISPMGPTALGYYPDMGPADHSAAFPAIESIMEMSEQRKMVPFLAEAVDIDEKKLTFTIRLRKGIKFHDGSDLNAEACAWNYQLLKDSNKIQYGDQIKKIEIVNDSTVVLHLTAYNNQMPWAFGWVPMLSKVAFETKGKEWCRSNIVATGPFKQVEWKRDAYLKWAKFDGYWQKGKPYLDAIEYRYVPDPVTASAMMQTKEGDIWINVPSLHQSNLEKSGLIRKYYWSALETVLYINTKDANRPTANLKVREAIEYAIDKPALAKALGFGYLTPLKMIHPKGEWAYDENWRGRPYNPVKAKQLLTEAGFPNGIKIKLLAVPGVGGGKEIAEGVASYLNQVGINTDVDMADPGRYWGSVFVKGWDDLVLCFAGVDYNSLATMQTWFGHQPKTNLASFKRTDKLLALSKESITFKEEAKQKEWARKMSMEISEQALMVPLFHNPAAYIMQPYVHTNYLESGMVRWKMYDMWMSKH